MELYMLCNNYRRPPLEYIICFSEDFQIKKHICHNLSLFKINCSQKLERIIFNVPYNIPSSFAILGLNIENFGLSISPITALLSQ